jgi:hypothetical protein
MNILLNLAEGLDSITKNYNAFMAKDSWARSMEVGTIRYFFATVR